MGCTDLVCGTGEWAGPLPGDPGNNATLNATGNYGGIDVTWTYPTLNAHAVIHTQVYRGTSSEFSQATLRAIKGGNTFFDSIPKMEIRPYYYWIRIVSVNGTTGDPIGPALATPMALVDVILPDLVGQIDEGVLAKELREEIARIGDLQTSYSQEVIDRLVLEGVLVNALDAVQSETGELKTLIQHETIQRLEAHSGLLATVNVLAVGVDNNAAALTEISAAQATLDSAIATKITTLEAKMANDLSAALQVEQTARVNGDSALSGQITTTQATLGNNIAAVQTNLQSTINTVNGKVTEIGALYTAKVSVNGLIGGFGIYNNGSTVQAGFDVDTFWVGRTGPDKVKPFLITDGVVHIDSARIRNADITTLKIAGNAVTMPLYAEGGYGSTGAITAAADMAGGSAIIMAKVRTVAGNAATLSVRRNGVVIYSTTEGRNSREEEGQTGYWYDTVFSFKDSSPTSSTYYSITADNNTTFLFTQLTVIGCKR